MGFLLFPECPDLPSPGEPHANGRDGLVDFPSSPKEKEKKNHPVLILCDLLLFLALENCRCSFFPPPVPMTKRVRLRARGGGKRARRAGS